MTSLTLEEVAEALVTCEVCREEFNEDSRAPMLMPDCRHLFCAQCVENIAALGKESHLAKKAGKESNFRKFPCPKCRKTIELEGHSGVKGLSKDIITMNAIEFVSMKRKVMGTGIPCSDCLDKAMASHRCQACCLNMCTKCHEAHRRLPRTRTHKVVDLQTLMTSAENFVQEDDPCAQHEDKRYEIYCKTCHEALCVTCALVSHQGHEMNELQKVYKDCLKQNQELREQVSEKIEKLQRLKKRQERIQDGCKRTQEKVEREITDMFRKLAANLEERRKELNAACALQCRADYAQEGDITQEVTSLMKELQETANVLQTAEKMTRPAEFISWQREQLPRVQGKLAAPEPRLQDPPDVRLVQSGLQSFQSSLACLGRVKAGAASLPAAPPVAACLQQLFTDRGDVQQWQLDDENLAFDYVVSSERKLAFCKMAPVFTSAHVTYLQCLPCHFSQERVNVCEAVITDEAKTTLGTLIQGQARQNARDSSLVKYPGTVASETLVQGGGTYWEVEVSVCQGSEVSESSLVVVELAVAPGDEEDVEEQVVRRQGWGVEVGVCRDLGSGLCLWGMSQGGVVCHTPLTAGPLSEEPSSPTRATLGFMLANGRLCVYDVTKTRRLCQMAGVDCDVTPWFGFWESHFESRLVLKTGKDLQLNEDKARMLAADL